MLHKNVACGAQHQPERHVTDKNPCEGKPRVEKTVAAGRTNEELVGTNTRNAGLPILSHVDVKMLAGRTIKLATCGELGELGGNDRGWRTTEEHPKVLGISIAGESMCLQRSRYLHTSPQNSGLKQEWEHFPELSRRPLLALARNLQR